MCVGNAGSVSSYAQDVPNRLQTVAMTAVATTSAASALFLMSIYYLSRDFSFAFRVFYLHILSFLLNSFFFGTNACYFSV